MMSYWDTFLDEYQHNHNLAYTSPAALLEKFYIWLEDKGLIKK